MTTNTNMKENNTYPNTPVNKQTELEAVRQKAIQTFEQEWNGMSHLDYNIEIRETTECWVVYFEDKILLPGNHAIVSIDKKTGEATYMAGE